jgi:thiamine-phosphate pyrophosphorylase
MGKNLVSYLITDPQYYSNDLEIFEKNLKKALKSKKINIACFRDKTSENFKELAEIFVKICKKFEIEKILLNEDFKLAKKLGATGVHLTSKQFHKIKKAKILDLYVIISCHDYHDIENALSNHANAITYSPVFKTPGKGEPKGLANFRETVKIYEDDIDIFALGGIIDETHIKQIAKTKAHGFASIRYFV